MPQPCTISYRSPLGWLEIVSSENGLVSVKFAATAAARAFPQPEGAENAAAFGHCQSCKLQLAEYFAGHRSSFGLPLALQGTDFQLAVWRLLLQIPCGERRTYGQLANTLGKPGSERAIGNACGSNPCLIIVPCHRVVGSSGKLTGYAGGLHRKRSLLDLESNGKTGRQGELFE